MPCFYIRGGSFYAVFKIDEDGQVVAELQATGKLVKEIKERNIAHSIKTLYADDPIEEED